MNRELKFRVWNPTYREMLYPSSPTKNGDYEEKIYLQLDGQLIGDFKHTGITNCSEHYVILQFTGMLDKNGKEIYEGDILCQYPDYVDSQGGQISPTIGKVYFEFGCFYFDKLPLNEFIESEFSASQEFPILERIEVIGNIFENENLL